MPQPASLRVVVAAALSMAACISTASAEPIAIKAGHLVDPATGKALQDRVVLVNGAKIVDVLDRLPSPAPATVIDLSASWVLPGLMDLHTHLSYDYTGTLCANYVEHGNGYRALMGLRRAQDMLVAGFTTVRDLGNAGNFVDTDLRRAIDAGLFAGPTIINAGKIIAPFGAQQDNAAPEIGPCWNYEYFDADGVEEVRKAVRKNIFYGARVIKLVSDPRGKTHGFYTEEEIRVAADEAHRAGLTLAVHAKEDATVIPAILGGADSIEHAYTVSDATLKLMKQKGVYLVSTDKPVEHVHLSNPRDPAAAETNARSKVERLRRAYQIGVPLAFGTDVTEDLAGRDRGHMTLGFVEGWIDAGIPPGDILKAMTTHAATLLKLDGDRGAIVKGYYADIIATSANPLTDVRALTNVSFVMKDGKIIEHRR